MGSVSVNDTDINTFVFIPVSLSISQEKLLMLYRYRTLCRLLSPLLPSHQDLKVFHRALWVSLVAQLVKNPPTIQETRVRFLGWEDPLGKKKAGHSSILAWRTPWTVDCQAPLSMGFSRQGHWSGWPCPSPEDLPDPGIEPMSLKSPALAGGCFTTSTTWEACNA